MVIPAAKPRKPSPSVRLDGANPYRHQEFQFDYYEPARMHRPMMSGRWPVVVMAFLDVWYGVWLWIDYPLNGATFFASQIALALFIASSRGKP